MSDQVRVTIVDESNLIRLSVSQQIDTIAVTVSNRLVESVAASDVVGLTEYIQAVVVVPAPGGAAVAGPVGASGITMNTAKVLGRASASSGAIEELPVTGAGAVVLASSPSLTTPNIGEATGISFNGLTGLSDAEPLPSAVDGEPGDSAEAARADHIHPSNFTAVATDIKMNGTQSVGSLTIFCRADHVHPVDTSRQARLVSGETIRTVNNVSLLGSGNIELTLQDGDRGDIVVSNQGATFSIDNNVVTPAKMSRTGTAGQVLTSNGTGADPSYQDLDERVQDVSSLMITGGTHTGISFTYDDANAHLNATVTGIGVSTQTFTASGTWTKPSSGSMARIQVWGGGGGGSGCTACGGGGGGGEYREITVPLRALAASETVVVGAGGVKGIDTGGNGGTSSFGSLITAAGGGGSSSAGYVGGGGVGGGVTTSEYNISGSLAGYGMWSGGSGAAANGSVVTYHGCNALFGGGGGGHSLSTAAYGSSVFGGNGGINSTTPAQAPGGGGYGSIYNGGGGNGARGEVRITIW